ncbi:N-acetylmuramoyl-L-alanine amidase [Paenibacillus doosanensis]|uniref:N-acetylmuramoyl-L-alanine amidase n=1 Tax=Paenibacillus doosanensis TaxID=1229154 RepID=UPI0021803AE1|nr:N-acetylmuramoyl-L-alanine amidase [Paenibacillus doosanensis]MCS7458730.1 N-acetylmuramoyl-L-alanine amidase [Paenibacillus doosanensis]
MKRRPLTIILFFLALWMALPTSSFAAKIVVDAGHGGSDPGAVGVNGLYEKTVNLDIARKLKDFLTQQGYEVAMSRTDDTYVSLKDRVDFTNAQHADLFVSVHANSYFDPASRGAMVLYYDSAYPQADYPASPQMAALTPESRKLAQSVLDKFVETTGTSSLGLMESSVYVVRMGTIPSILVETAFLSNAQDADLLASDKARTQMAKAIALGIENYMPLDGKSAVFTDIRGHWASEPIARLQQLGIIDGVGSQFQPDRELTRAEWVTLLDRVFDLSKAQASAATGQCAASGTVTGEVYGPNACSGVAATERFKDVAPGHWAYATLNKAVRAGVLDGYADGTLRPDQPVTRAEVAAMFQRLALPLDGTAAAGTAPQPFRDVPPEHWAAQAIAGLKQAGWIDGMTADRYMPDRRMNRAEAAALLDRYVQSEKTASPK